MHLPADEINMDEYELRMLILTFPMPNLSALIISILMIMVGNAMVGNILPLLIYEGVWPELRALNLSNWFG